MIEQSIRNEILQLKKEKDVAILAHYYVDALLYNFINDAPVS